MSISRQSKKWGEKLGINTIGFCQQGTFLMSLGIDEAIAEIHKNSSDYLFEVARIKKLILPGTMGETHKVMIQYKRQWRAKTQRLFNEKPDEKFIRHKINIKQTPLNRRRLF